MSTQTTNLNYAAKGQVSLCLSYVDDLFGIPHAQPTATVAWKNTQFKHLDRNFPTDVTVPIWFTYRNQAGVDLGSHVAAHRPDGVILSSPWKAGTTHAELISIEQLISIYSDNGKNPMTYLGWSEDVAGVRVINPQGDDPMSEADIKNIVRAMIGRDPETSDLALANQSWHDVMYALLAKYGPEIASNRMQGVASAEDYQNFAKAFGDTTVPNDVAQASANQGYQKMMYEIFDRYKDKLALIKADGSDATAKLEEIKKILG